MKPNSIDLRKYDLKQLLRDPSLIHKIQDNLCKIEGDELLQVALRNGAVNKIQETIRTVIHTYRDNPKMAIRIVGKETLAMIEEFSGITLADDLKDVL